MIEITPIGFERRPELPKTLAMSGPIQTPSDLRGQSLDRQSAAPLDEVIASPEPSPGEPWVDGRPALGRIPLEPAPVGRAEPLGVVRRHRGDSGAELAGLDEETTLKGEVILDVQLY